MYTLVGSLRPPCAPSNVCFCEFLGPGKESLIMSSENYLLVYSLIHDQNGDRIRFEQRFRLWAEICSLAKCRVRNLDCLILAFYPARIAMIAYNPLLKDIETLSMHDYSDELSSRGLIYSPHPPIVRVDPHNRAACVLILQNTLIVMPIESWIPDSGKPVKTYLINLGELHRWAKARVVDFCFMSGFNTPTMFLLCEPRPNWTGRLAVEKDTCASLAVSINLSLQKNTVFWTNSELPYDCLYCLPVPSPLDGVVVVSNNAVFYMNQSTATFGIALNSNCQDVTNIQVSEKNSEHLKITLDSSIADFIDVNRLAISTKTGAVFLLELFSDSMHSVRSMAIEPKLVSVRGSCIVRCSLGFGSKEVLVFVGSFHGESVLVRLVGGAHHHHEICSRSILDCSNIAMDEIDALFADYAGSNQQSFSKRSIRHGVQYTAQIADQMICECPFNSVFGMLSESKAETDGKEVVIGHRLEMISTYGFRAMGGICKVTRSVPSHVMSTIDLRGCQELWALRSDETHVHDDLLIIVRNTPGTMVLRTTTDVEEVDDSGFDCDLTSLFCGNLWTSDRKCYAVQVVQGFRISLLRSNSKVHSVQHLGQNLVECYCSRDHVSLLIDGSIILYRVCDDHQLYKVDSLVCEESIKRHCLFDWRNQLHLAYVTFDNHLKCRTLGTLDEVFAFEHVNRFPRIFAPNSQQINPAKLSGGGGGGLPEISEILCIVNYDRLVLMMRAIEVFVYELFEPAENVVHLRKIYHDAYIHPMKENGEQLTKGKTIVPFKNIRDCQGVLICGNRPYWLLFTLHHGVRACTTTPETHIKSAAPFSNSTCSNGFVYLNDGDQLRIAEISDSYNYNALWPVLRKSLKVTVHSIAYFRRTKIYALCTSSLEPVSTIMQLSGEDKAVICYRRGPNQILPDRKRFTIQIFSSDWQLIPDEKIELIDWENVTCMKNVLLRTGEKYDSIKEYIAASTVNCYNEDVHARGRIIIFEVIDVVPDPDKPFSRYKLKIIHDRDERGAVTALDSVCGYLITAVGQKMFLWKLNDKELVGIAFLDVSVYIHRLTVFRNLIIAIDIVKGVYLLHFQEEVKVLSVLARDKQHFDILYADFSIKDRMLGINAIDIDGNMFVFNHKPVDVSSKCGSYLIKRSEFNVMSRSSCGMRVNTQGISGLCHVNIFATTRGAIKFLLPLDEAQFRVLMALQSVLQHGIPHYCGLNPKTGRNCVYRTSNIFANLNLNTVDMDLLSTFFDLNFNERANVARKTCRSVNEICDLLIRLLDAVYVL